MVSEDNPITLGGFTSDWLVSVQGIMLAQMPEFNIWRNRGSKVGNITLCFCIDRRVESMADVWN